MLLFPTFIVCFLGMTASVLTAISTDRRRKRNQIGPRALQARLVTPIALSLVGFTGLTITRVPSQPGVENLSGVLLLITMAVSSAIIPFALTCWIILIAFAKWTNVFAAIAIVPMGVLIGRVVGFRCGSRSNDR
ncbi:hypothetical protein SAMN05216228_1015131 [Rhizobium tibeticum]|uniref:Uncharacterized protein n=1 Tax=Rhizobium tibeticum TaxID=501024 RepID=A0A1H8NXX3_9HYPH|nr:hypothetical protein RTCCBAU85039_3578 [Rhizobium tibeticum]SEO34414.1 hypothetical protein SAMN05216228_1015131 [Rhizobium tibeticum]